jgi:hypothetical protein
MLMRQDASSFYAALIPALKIVAENASSLLPALLHSELLISGLYLSELLLSELLLSESLFPEQLFPERRG